MKARVVLVICMLIQSMTNAQSYYFTHYQVENGLSNNAVICSLQDSKGFLWFGTKDGLNRFDGYTFKIFRNQANDPKSIGSNFIYSLHEDQSGTLWVGCDRGLFAYNATTESFNQVPHAPVTEILDIQKDTTGDIWFISRLVLYQYQPKSGKLVAYNQPGHLEVTSICATGRGDLWVSSAAGNLHRLYQSGPATNGYSLFSHSKTVASNWIEKIMDAGGGLIWVGTSKQGAKLFDTKTHTYKDILSLNTDGSEIFVRDFIKADHNEYWIATESGIYIYNTGSAQYINLKKNYNNPYSVSDNAVYTFCRDKEGGIWAGTYFGGVNYYPKQYTHFKKYFPQNGSNSISGNAVREIVRDRAGHLWIGTEDAGLNRLDVNTGQFTHFNPGSGSHPIAASNIHGLLIDSNELWIGTFHRGLDVLDVRTGKVIRHYSLSTQSLPSDFIYCFLKTRAGEIIIGTDRGLCRYNRHTDNFEAIQEAPGNFYTILYEDKQGTIWAGTYSEGVFYYNPQTKQHGHFVYEPGNRSSLSGNRVNWIFEDSRGQLWIATEGGLCRMNKNQQFTCYTTQNGFPGNIFYAVLEDARHNFWVSTSKGLACFTPSTGAIKVYTRANGLLNDQFNYNSAFKDPSGRMYFGSVKGLISFHPDEFIQNNFESPVYITGFQVYDKELAINKEGSPLRQSITYTNQITLAHNQSSFSIDFAALSYTAPDMTEYAYKMDGLNDDWTYLKTNRKAYFTELSPGTYHFTVKASTSGSEWNCAPASLTIKILPPIWASGWAYLLYCVLAIVIIWYLVRSYHLRTEEKNRRKLEILEHEKEREIYQAKIEFFTNVAHEIRTPLTLIKGPMEKVMKQIEAVPAIRNNLQIMQRNTNRLLDLTTQLLDFRKTETNGFSLNFVKANIAELLTDAYLRFKPAAEQKKLSFVLDSPQLFNAYVDMEAFNKILSNLLDNALKYADTKVNIRLVTGGEQDTVFMVEVKNDGYLIPYEMKEKIFESFFRIKETGKQSGTGIGLALSRSLAELHKGVLYLKEADGDMNVFVLVLPVHQEIEFNLGR